ncbi:MAG: hypothetical protein IPP88_21730 [Betaproteobacteria bacterium]|nr:hypothetical protein [Betaproteobacteria bacterium]
MNKSLLIILGTFAAVVSASWYFLRPPTDAVMNASAESAATSSKAPMAAGGSASVLPLDNLQQSSPVKISVARSVVPLKSALAQEFEKARQLKVFYDRYAANPEGADAETKFFAALAMERCVGRGRGSQGPSEADKTRFQNRLKENDPSNAQRIEAFNRVTETCEGFASTNISAADISKLYREAAAQGNPAAKVAVAADLNREQNRNARGIEERRMSEDQLAMVRDALSTGDPFAIERAGQLLSWGSTQLADRKVGPNGDPYTPRDWAPAWQLAACDRGANCGADAYKVLYGCAHLGACGYDNLETYMQFNELAPNTYAAAVQIRATILEAIAQGRWDWLGIAAGMGRTVTPAAVASNTGGTRTTSVAPPGPAKRGG